MPTPSNYILDPGDQIEMMIYGVQQFSFTGTINKNGSIAIPNIGAVYLSGMTIDAAKEKLKTRLRSIYSSLGGSSQLSVTIDNYRTILVTIIGTNQPGNYRLSSMSTVFNALHVAGGPSDIGSYRKIELIRNNKPIKTIDLYRFLTKGDQSDNITLEDNEVIRIPSYDARIVLEGEIKNPGIFEILPNESLGLVIEYASGLTERAYTNRILVKQKTPSELKITDLNATNYRSYIVNAGDIILIDKILDRYENRIQIKGAVYRPGEYSLNANEPLTLLELINKADGLKENAFIDKATLIRQNDDLTLEYISVDLRGVLQNNVAANFLLKKEGQLVIFFNQELLDTYNVSIDGEVRSPGVFPFGKGKTLYDLLLESEYFTNKAAGKISIYRSKIDDKYNRSDREKIQTLTFDIDPKNPELAESILLEPMDRVVVRRVPTFETPELITLLGQVIYPGNYALANKDEKIYDVINKSGGVKNEADYNSIHVKRKGLIIPIDWSSIIRNPQDISKNLILLANDTIVVPKKNFTVHVTGNVMFETKIPYNKGKSMSYYLKNAGGGNDKSWDRKTYIIYPNGSASATRSFLGIKSYPKVSPGSTIVVPEKPERKGTSTGEIVGIASVLTSLAGVLFAVFR